MSHRSARRDQGTVLPLVLVITIALGGVVLAIATYSTTSLRYARVAEERSDRLSAADAGMRYALDQIKLKARGCVWDDAIHTLPGVATDFNDAFAEVECQRITSGLDDIDMYAAVMTGQGLPASGSDSFLLSSQGGSNAKVLGGPVYMQRIDTAAFNFSSASTDAGVDIEDGPLLYFEAPDPDPTISCVPEKPSVVVARAAGKLTFTPDLIFGPECVDEQWWEKFTSPEIPADLTALPERDGSLAITPSVPFGTVTTALLNSWESLLATSPAGGYVDITGSGNCRVFFPGRYTTTPSTANIGAYFMSGEYVMDLPSSNAKLQARQGVITAGVPNPRVFVGTEPVANERANTPACNGIQNLDPANADPEVLGGATFYLAGSSFIEVETQGSLEIHGRRQGDRFVSVQTLCKTTGHTQSYQAYCAGDGDGGLGNAAASTLNGTTSEEVLYTDSGNGKEFVAHGLFYAPLAEAEFGNVSNSAIQKLKGGIIVAQLILQAATSATNFEIAVPTSPITGKIEITSTATKHGGTTSIRAIVEYRPYEVAVDDRVAVNSWRVCGVSC